MGRRDRGKWAAKVGLVVRVVGSVVRVYSPIVELGLERALGADLSGKANISVVGGEGKR